MAYQLVWAAEAEDDFKKIILYLNGPGLFNLQKNLLQKQIKE